MKIKQYRKLNDKTILKKAEIKATTWFNKYIRLRDLQRLPNGEIMGKCISCGKIWNVDLYSDRSIINPRGASWCASHYFLSDRNASVRYDERNVNLACYRCNKHLHGNLAPYKINLIKKIGKKEFEDLERTRNQIKKLNILDLERIEIEYKLKAQLRANELQIKV